jgi:uncharacterized protein YutE (UPF0331/DUF86 family)
MGSRERIALFVSELDLQVSEIESVYRKLEGKQRLLQQIEVRSEDVESLGYWLHNLYNAFEDLFQLVAEFWENEVSQNGSGHKNLLRRMRLEIQGIRPALISEKAFEHLDELRGFRHVFRHAYSHGLDEERARMLLRRALKHQSHLLQEIQTFRSRIENLFQSPEE